MDSYYLLGYPIAHSLSPAMQNLAFEANGIDAHYGLREADETSLPSVVDSLRLENAAGWNCTMPCKHVMMTLCDELTTAARIGGAVNTVENRNGKLIGHTTDGIGFMNAAADAGFPLTGEKFTLLGTGGAASAILIQAVLDGASEVAVFWNRPSSREHIEQIAEKLAAYSSTRIIPCSYDTPGLLKNEISESRALVNATNIGMEVSGKSAGCLIPDASYLHSGLFVYDIIYHPAVTPLLRLAEAVGCSTSNGLSMLIGQGAEAFRIWTGKTMPKDRVRDLILSR